MVALLAGLLPKGEHVLSSPSFPPFAMATQPLHGNSGHSFKFGGTEPISLAPRWLCLKFDSFAYLSPLHLTLPLL